MTGGYNHPNILVQEIFLLASRLVTFKYLNCGFVAVHFYGKNQSIEEKFPIKTNQDALREGYQYNPTILSNHD